MANITDLTGYTVTVPSGWTATAWYGVFSVVIEWINPQSSYYIEYGASQSLFLGYDGDNQIGARYYNETSSGTYSYWDKITNSQSLSFTITGGTDTTNTNLIQWLYGNNATFEKTGGEEEPTPTKKFTKLNIGEVVYSSGGKCFKRLTTELPLNAGLYDVNDNLVASWDTLVNTYGMDCEKDYTSSSYETDTASPYYVLTNYAELANGVKLVIGNSVTSIGDYAFYDCGGLTSVVIPDGVTTIGFDAFSYCYSLTSVTIPNSVTSISGWAFSNCSSLSSVVIGSSVTTIGGRAFLDCTSLTSILVSDKNQYFKDIDGNLYTKDGTKLIQYSVGKTDTTFIIPDSVTSIGHEAFYNCESLTTIEIPNGVTSIGGDAFSGCSSLTSIVIPDSVTTIGWYAFWGCSSITSIIIPDGVTEIEEGTFENCSSLTEIVIPDSVTRIGFHAFRDSSSLTDVYYTGSESEWNQIYIASENAPLYNATIHYNYVKKLSPPTISISGSVISITGSNNVSVRYWVYVNGESLVSTTENSTSIDIAGLNLEKGTYSIYLVAVADGYVNSDPSNTVEYVVR